MSVSGCMERVEKLKEKVKNEKIRVEMMQEQLDLYEGKEILIVKSELVGLCAKSNFLEQYFLSNIKESEIINKDITPEGSLNLGLTGILALAIGEQQYTDDLEEALQHSFKIIRVKDEEILNLEEKISVTEEFKHDSLQSLKQENESLKNLCKLHKNQVKRYKKENIKHREVIFKLESDLCRQSEKLRLLKNINNSQNTKIQALCAEIEKKNLEFDSLEKVIEKVDSDSYRKTSTAESSLNSEKFSFIIQSLKEENKKLRQENQEIQEKLEKKYEREHVLCEKTKKELRKMKEIAENLKMEIFDLEEEKKLIMDNAEKRMQRVRSETAEVLSVLRSEKRILQKKVQEMQSKDFSVESDEPRPSLKDEIVDKDDLRKGSFSSICEFTDVVQARFVSEEFVQGFKEKAENLEKVVEDMKRELSEKDELIVELRGKIGRFSESQPRKSILLRVVPNPIVLKLFRKN